MKGVGVQLELWKWLLYIANDTFRPVFNYDLFRFIAPVSTTIYYALLHYIPTIQIK